MTATILVTGGTGTLGRHVVKHLREAGQDVRVLSRRPQQPREGVEYVVGDLATGEGVDTAVDGVGAILHLAGSANGDDDKTRTLVQAATSQQEGPHIVYISVVGADRPSFSYFAAKCASEQILTESGLPWTILRATQFHELLLKVVRGMAKLRSCRRLPGSGSSPSRPRRWPRASSRSRSASPPGEYPTSQSAGCASAVARQGCPRVPGGRQSGSRSGGGPAHVGRIPRDEGELRDLSQNPRGKRQGGDGDAPVDSGSIARSMQWLQA